MLRIYPGRLIAVRVIGLCPRSGTRVIGASPAGSTEVIPPDR